MKLIQKPVILEYDGFPFITSNGIMGGKTFACDSELSYQGAYKIFNIYPPITHGDLQISRFGSCVSWYHPNPVNITQLKVEVGDYYRGTKFLTGKIQASNDNNTWNDIANYSVNDSHDEINLSYSDYYCYYRMTFDSNNDYIVFKNSYISASATTPTGTCLVPKVTSILQPTRKYYKYIDIPWTQPIVTASSSTATSIITQGHTIYSCGGVRASGYPLSYLFDGSTADSGCPIETASTGYVWTQVYNPNPIKASNIKIYWNAPGSSTVTATVTIEASNDGENWTTLSSGTTSSGAGFANIIEHNVSLSTNTNFYKYYKIINTTPYLASGHAYWYVREIEITATQKTIVEGTSSDYDFYEDIETYQAIV